MLTDQQFFPSPMFMVGESFFYDDQGLLQFDRVLTFRDAAKEMDFLLALVASVPLTRMCSRLVDIRRLGLPTALVEDFNPEDEASLNRLRRMVSYADFIMVPEMPAAVVVPRAKQIDHHLQFLASLTRLAQSIVPYSQKALLHLYQ